MARSFDYSKWDKIELSDDESDCHPNIDKESWFRMKHRSRLEREEKEDIEVVKLEKLNGENQSRLNIIKARLTGLQSGQADEDAEFEDLDALRAEASELERQIGTRLHRIAEIKEKRAWNIDNICRVTEEKTIVNSSTATSLKADDFVPTGATESAIQQSPSAPETVFRAPTAVAASASSDGTGEALSSTSTTPVTTKPAAKPKAASSAIGPAESGGAKAAISGSASRQKFAVISYNDYVISHEALLETYSEIQSMERTKEYLFKNCDVLLHEHAQSYMLLSCLEDEMNGKRERMKLVCRQSQILSHITELGVSMKRDPRDVILPFFRRIEEPEYMKGFQSAVGDFTERIKRRAVEKRKEMEAEEAEQRRASGELDPFEVLESLPPQLKAAFESQDIERLQSVLASMNPVEAKACMKRCVDSGLWVPSDKSIFEDTAEEGEEDESEDDGKEEWERQGGESKAGSNADASGVGSTGEEEASSSSS